MKNKCKKKKIILILTAAALFCAVGVCCCYYGYWTFNKFGMTPVETVARYCTYFDRGNTVGVNSLHFNSGEYGFHMTYSDTSPFRGDFVFESGKDIGKKESLMNVEKIVSEAVSGAYDYTVVEAEIKRTKSNKNSVLCFVLVKKSKNSRWRICWMG